MYIQERQNAIVAQLNQTGLVKVKDLSKKFGVTEDCIRKDLKTLEGYGRLRRIYGGAILSQDYPLKRNVVDRRDVHVEQKEVIAKKAADMIADHSTVFLDTSTTNIMVAKCLVSQGKRLIAVSPMIDILQILSSSAEITAVGTGGTMYRTINGFMGIEAARAISAYSFDAAFLGCCGIDTTDCTITTLGAEDGLTKYAAIKAARHRYIVMESQKFEYNECYKFAHFDDIDGIITDRLPNPETSKVIQEAGVRIY